MPKKHIIAITAIYLALCSFYLWRMNYITYPGFPLDDSWIHQVFARNIATGHGFSFNPDIPIAGATAPLWTLFLVPMWLLFGPVTGGIALGMLTQWLAILAVYKLTERITNDRFLSILAAVLSVLCWPVIWGALSGMEVGLYSALTLWGLFFYFKSNSLDDIYNYLSYLLFTLAFLARPECALFVFAVIVRDAIAAFRSHDKRALPWAIKIAILLVLTAPYFAFNYSTAGSLFPRTYLVKVRGKDLFSSIFAGDFKTALKASAIYPLMNLQDFSRNIIKINPLIFAAAAAGMVRLLHSKLTDRSKNIMVVILCIFYTPLIGVLSPKYMPSFQNFRYAAHLIIIMAVFGALGLFWQTDKDYHKYRKPLFILGTVIALGGLIAGAAFSLLAKGIARLIVRNAAILTSVDMSVLRSNVWNICIGISIIGLLILFAYILIKEKTGAFLSSGKKIIAIISIMIASFIPLYKADLYAHNIRNINECDVEVGIFLGSFRGTGDSAAANDIGAIGYFSGMETVDLKGLTEPEITLEMLRNDSLLFEFIKSKRRIDYLAIAPGWYDYLLKRTDIFKEIRVFSSDNCTNVVSDTTIVFRAAWPD